MLVELWRGLHGPEAEGYLYDVFIARMNWWTVLGFVAQGLFTMRFVVQWLASERAGRSVVPFSFWTLSVGGGALLLAYAVVQHDPVYILGQVTSLLIYSRNISFVLRERRATEVRPPEATTTGETTGTGATRA